MQQSNVEINDLSLLEKGIYAINDFYHVLANNEIKLPGLNGYFTGINSHFFNVVIDTQKNVLQDNSTVVEEFFAQYALPWAWFITPLSKNNSLESRGFYLLETYPSMYLDLSQDLIVANDDSIFIEEAKRENNLYDWIEAIQESFPSVDKCEAYRQLNVKLLDNSEGRLRHYIAYYKNNIAASATLFVNHEIVMLHNLGTKIAYRKLGIGTALTYYLLQVAKSHGFRHCFLDASEDAFNLYKRIGFKVYANTSVYAKG